MKKWIAAAAIAIPSVTLATLQQQPDTSSGLTLPPGWEKMEIEAKWDIDKAQYDALVKGHPDNGAKLGYDLNVRWGGISRQFIDFYYDSPAHTLAKSLHSIRHRTRSTSDPRAPSNEFAELEKANWDEDWQRIQYKSTPTRIGAVWFRAETGDCRISDSGGNNLCPDAHQNGYTAEKGMSRPLLNLVG